MIARRPDCGREWFTVWTPPEPFVAIRIPIGGSIAT
jgi:hypothetical protein